jgi:hypothetical protein
MPGAGMSEAGSHSYEQCTVQPQWSVCGVLASATAERGGELMLHQLRIPPVFETFCLTHFALTRRDMREWWRGMSLSQSPRVIALRGTLQYRGTQPYRRTNVETLLRVSVTPQELIETAELLVQECWLTRQCATRVQDAVLQRTGPSGVWK